MKTLRLGDLAEIQSGHKFSSRDYVDDGYFLVRIGNLQDGWISREQARYVRFAKNDPQARFILCEGDILVSLTGDVGRVGVVNPEHLPAVLNQRVARLRLRGDSPVDRRFLVYFLRSETCRRWLNAASRGAAQQNVSVKALLKMKIPVPSRRVQEQMVRRLDEAFKHIAVVRLVVEKNLQNVKALFQNALALHFGAVTGQTLPLGSVCGFQNGFIFQSRRFRPAGTPVLRISNIQNEEITTDSLVFVDPADYRENLDRYRVFPGDLVIALSGATTGKVGFNHTDTTFYLNQRVGKFLPSRRLHLRYLFYFLLSKVEENHRQSLGAAQLNLSVEQLRAMPLPLPPLPEQQAVVARLDAIREHTRILEGVFQRKMALLDELGQALLHEAFSGNVTLPRQLQTI